MSKRKRKARQGRRLDGRGACMFPYCNALALVRVDKARPGYACGQHAARVAHAGYLEQLHREASESIVKVNDWLEASA